MSTQPYMDYALELYQMRIEPLATAEDLCAGWRPTVATRKVMSRLVHAAERAGDIEATRAAVRRCLHDPETPGTAWSSAEPWFPDTWTEELDEDSPNRRAVPGDPPAGPLRSDHRSASDPPAGRPHPHVGPLPGRGQGHLHLQEPAAGRVARATDRSPRKPPRNQPGPRGLPLDARRHARADRAGPGRGPAPDPRSGGPGRPGARGRPGPRAQRVAGRARRRRAGRGDHRDRGPGRRQTLHRGPLVDLEAAEAAFHAGREPMLQERLARVFESDEGPPKPPRS